MAVKFAYFVELTKSYQPEKFQCCRFSGSSFTEGLQNTMHMITSFHIFWIQNFYIL